MALNATDLKNQIKTDLLNKDNATDALNQLATTCSTYIKTNAEITFVWTAALVNPPNTPDPITVAIGEIITLEFTLTPSLATTQPEGILTLKNQLIIGLTAAIYNITEIGFSTQPGAMSTSPSLTSLTLTISGDSQDTAIEQLASGIIDWVKLQVPIAPCSGTHGVYTGAGLVSSIL